MNKTLPYKTKQFFFVLIKLSIVLAAFYFIYNKLTNNDGLQFSDFVDFLSRNNIFTLKNIILLLFLSILNWFFEILKWKALVSFVKKITFKNALEQSLGALTASLFTPNRIGEYGAKAIYYSANFRKPIVLINLLSNVLQMAVTTIFGVIGLYFFTTIYPINFNYHKLVSILFIGLILVLLIGFGFKKSKLKIKGVSLKKVKHFILKFPKEKIWIGFMFSLWRYLIFSYQFYFLLQLFEIEIPYFNAMVIITSMYVLASVIPSIFIFDVVIKGSIALYLFAFINVNELTILSIITTMWLLNFVLPSVFGSYYVLNFNLPKTED
ncbi:lysylphosphatidylglycerol synthase domain-containing protein [Hwangdonia lutea]|uniref:Lysylphosphatidylglycerol synthase domain-containing protein n=1 Tax=Hwangdonia lutea TaxID=3075823 RepID=A0AA97EN75_9FLAO|nr:lysylphosphatidylglycerol synthase domain-containing protein [Hwangdonia sp. SCSIO 19198]WOD44634.1 lysylphosphatidylglycerol synthase domain-containing protein [Hwangdonia sp. SCSIO 19198]